LGVRFSHRTPPSSLAQYSLASVDDKTRLAKLLRLPFGGRFLPTLTQILFYVAPLRYARACGSEECVLSFVYPPLIPQRASAPRKRSGLLSVVPGGTGSLLVLAAPSLFGYSICVRLKHSVSFPGTFSVAANRYPSSSREKEHWPVSQLIRAKTTAIVRQHLRVWKAMIIDNLAASF